MTDITFEQDMKLQIQESCQLFELSYCVSGEIYCEWNGKKSHTSIQTGNVTFLEAGNKAHSGRTAALCRRFDGETANGNMA